tara:strand:- start:33771 stop:34007 length:237 start_codon:yes stop_codon:yes gene_type:complete
MAYSFKDIDKILSFKSWNTKQIISEMFKIDADLYCNLGSESTKSEKKEVKRKSKYIYKAINKIDPTIGKSLLFYMDQD